MCCQITKRFERQKYTDECIKKRKKVQTKQTNLRGICQIKTTRNIAHQRIKSFFSLIRTHELKVYPPFKKRKENKSDIALIHICYMQPLLTVLQVHLKCIHEICASSSLVLLCMLVMDTWQPGFTLTSSFQYFAG